MYIAVSIMILSNLFKARACDEASRTTCWTPPLISLSIKLFNSKDSGVVNPVLIIFVGEMNPKVPMLPVFNPQSLKILLIKYVVVVFPLVPVTPIVPIFEDGFSKKLLAGDLWGVVYDDKK